MSGIYEIFIYRPVNSVIHRRSPFVRPIFPVIALLASIIANNVLAALIILASAIVFTIIAKSMYKVIKILRSTLIFSIILFMLALLADGLEAAFVSMLKFIDAIISISLIGSVISMEELEAMGRLVGLPRDITFVFAVAVKFIPIMLSDLQEIIHSYESRGIEFNFKNPVKLVGVLAQLIMHLTRIAIKRSEELADAMIVRGYGIYDKPTLPYRFTVTKKDLTFAVLSAVAGSIIVCVTLIPGII
jgi:energy-coupling factor transport system permease protein